MISISPVLHKDITQETIEVLSEDFQNRCWGNIALAISDGATLTPPIGTTQRNAHNLLHGVSADGASQVPTAPDDIAAWRVSFSASPALNLLYALTPVDVSSRIRTAQERASSTMLGELAACVLDARAHRGCTGWLMEHSQAMGSQAMGSSSTCDVTANRVAHLETIETPICRYVLFRSEVSDGLYPHLDTTAFLMNRVRFERGDVRVLASTEEMARFRLPLYEAYAGALDYFVEKAIGQFQRVPHCRELRIAGMPQEMIRNFFCGPRFDREGPTQGNHATLTREEMFGKWRARATELGWGPKEATKLLRHIRQDEFWADVKSRCAHGVRHAGEFLRDTTATIGRLITRGDNRKRKIETRSQSKEHRHTHSQSH